MSTDAAAELRMTPLNPFVLGIWVNGLYTTLFFVTLWAIWKKSPRDRRSWIWIALTVSMYACSTIYSGVLWGYNVTVIQDNGATPAIVDVLNQNPAWYKGVGMTMFSVNIFIADCLFIWRCWVVWEKRWVVVVLPILGTIAGQVLNILGIIGSVELSLELAPTQVPISFANLATPYFGISLATSLITTSLIALRIFMIQREMRGVGMRAQGSYSKILEILIESAALYSINLLVFVILLSRLLIQLEYPEAMMSQISGIAPTLIICRVALGHSRPDSEWSRRNRDIVSNIDIEFASGPNEPVVSTMSKSSGTAAGSDGEKRKDSSRSFVRSLTTSTNFSQTSSQISTAEKDSPV